MAWLQRHAWQFLLTMTVLMAVIGFNPVVNGINEDPSVPLGLAGMTAVELQANNAQSFRLIVQTRFTGLDLIFMGTLLSAVLVGAFRHNARWAWWAMWLLPLWATSVFVMILMAGLMPGQPPPSPVISGPVIALLSSGLLLVVAPQFFGRQNAR